MKLFLTLCELVVQVLNLTAVGCGTALAWTPVARPVRQASLKEDVEDVGPNKVRVQPAQKAHLCLGLLQVTQFLTLCVLVVQALNRTARGVGDSVGMGASGDLSAGVVFPDSLQPGRAVPTGAATTPTRTPPIMLQDVYVSKLIAFSPDKERWMKA
ncbi:hypothetical protein PF010_g33231, partial [Phytophthora fragariae]